MAETTLINRGYRSRLLIAPLTAASLLAACGSTTSNHNTAVTDASRDRLQARLQDSTPAYRNTSMLDMADKLASEGNYEAAIPLYRSAGSSPRQRLGLAKAMLAYGKPAAALGLSEGANSADMLTVRGSAALALGEFAVALDAFGRAVAKGGGARARAGYGVALAIDGQVGAALDQLDGLGSASAEANRALVLIVSGQAQAGTMILEDMIRNGSAGVKERQNLALGYILDGRDADAMAMARLDLDQQTAIETIGFYRQLQALDTKGRMKALVLGAVDPAWTRRDSGNLLVENTAEAAEASLRVIDKPVVIAAVKPEPEPERPPLPDNAPPLLEPEGWAVQIAAYRKIEELIRGWEILRTRNIDILEAVPPRRSEVDFGTRDSDPNGFFYRLNAGPLETLAEARTLCDTLADRGTACWVRPPEPTEGRIPSEEPEPKSAEANLKKQVLARLEAQPETANPETADKAADKADAEGPKKGDDAEEPAEAPAEVPTEAPHQKDEAS